MSPRIDGQVSLSSDIFKTTLVLRPANHECHHAPPRSGIWRCDRSGLLFHTCHDRSYLDPKPIHSVRHKDLRRVQRCFEKRQAGAYRSWHSLRLDLGCHLTPKCYCRLQVCDTSLGRLSPLLRISSIDMELQGHSGMLQAQRFRSSCFLS